MITAQDIHEKTFATVRINGYDKPSVDDFLDELAEEIGAAQKENAVLKSKMKVLVDKIEEYRANEEALNMAVISAQKLAVQIESEARSRASAILADAEAQAQAKVGGITAQVESEEKRLADAKVVTAAFLKKAKELVGSELKALETIGTKLEVKDSMAPAPKEAAPAPAPAPAPGQCVQAAHRAGNGSGFPVGSGRRQALQKQALRQHPALLPVKQSPSEASVGRTQKRAPRSWTF